MHRSRLRRRLSVCSLGAAVAVAVVVLAPGIAQAAPVPGLPTQPPDPLSGVAGTLGGAPGGGGTAAADTSTAAPDPSAGQSLPTAPSSPPPLDPSQLQAFLAALGISPECSAAVQKDLQNAVQDLPATAQAVVDAIVGQMPSGPPAPPPLPISATDPQTGATVLLQQLGNGQPPTFSSPDPSELPTVKDLQQLADDLQNLCQPKPPAPDPPTSGGSQPPSSQQPVSAPQPPAAAPPPAQPLSYPGYAPTGAAPVQPSDGGPLAALAGIVLLSAAGAASYRMVFRAGPRP